MRIIVGSQWVPYGCYLFLWGFSQCLRLAKIMRFLELVSFPKTDVVGSNFRPRMLARHHRGWRLTFLGEWITPNLNWLICDDCILGGWSNTSYHHVVLSIFFLISLQSYVLIHLQLSKPSWISRQMCISQLAMTCNLNSHRSKNTRPACSQSSQEKKTNKLSNPKNLEKNAVWHLQVLRIVDGFANHPTNEVEKVQVVSSDIRPPSRHPGRSTCWVLGRSK